MVPNIIVVDSEALDFYLNPIKGAQIFEKFVKVHPNQEEKVVSGLIAMFGDVFTVMTMEKYNEIEEKSK